MSIRFPHLGISLGYVAETVSVFGYEFTIYGILMTAGLLLGLAVIILRAGRSNQDQNLYLEALIPGILLAVLGWRQWKADRDTALRYLLILGVSLYPYLWYIAFSNHSQIHYFFTYRAQVVTVFGVLAVLLGLLGDWCQSRRKSL